MSVSLRHKRVEKKSKRVEDKRRSMEKKLGIILEDVPTSLSINPSLTCYEVSFVKLKLFLESYLSHMAIRFNCLTHSNTYIVKFFPMPPLQIFKGKGLRMNAFKRGVKIRNRQKDCLTICIGATTELKNA
ncbi:hypothetical protein M9H77_02417 [Catharanthus roseus]|uniref:Uncharacterized protein n=1 Tax=Catharanthus roseus TaxID=4058 RepID=A0ACC0C8H6_CATRO|nr:hypothetical protein M9H77_02417 [Catharanthus roseus]